MNLALYSDFLILMRSSGKMWQPPLPSTTITIGFCVAGKTLTASLSLKTKARDAREWGQIGASCNTGTSGVTTGPPALKE